MGRVEGDIHEEGFAGVTLLNITPGFLSQQEGLVALVINRLAITLEIFPTLVTEGREKAYLGMQVTIDVLPVIPAQKQAQRNARDTLPPPIVAVWSQAVASNTAPRTARNKRAPMK